MSWEMRMIALRLMSPCRGEVVYDLRFTYYDLKIRYTIYALRQSLNESISSSGYFGAMR